jgi:Ca2+-binding RTX toxin-like protein
MLFGVAQRVELVGSPGVDRLASGACGLGMVEGRGGDDDILFIRDDALPRKRCHPQMRVDGGAGTDSIRGTVNADDLRGGGGNDWIKGRKGRDRADGGPGRDTCLAERERRCEH